MTDHLYRRIGELEEQVEELRAANASLEAALFGRDWEAPLELGLTVMESRTLQALVMRERCSRDSLFQAATSPGAERTSDIKSVDMVIMKLRRKLHPHGIRILTLWGYGFRIEEADRARLKAWEQQGGAAHD